MWLRETAGAYFLRQCGQKFSEQVDLEVVGFVLDGGGEEDDWEELRRSLRERAAVKQEKDQQDGSGWS